MQYRSCRFDYTDYGVCVRNSKGEFLCYCETDAEAEDYIDSYLDDLALLITKPESPTYFVYRIVKGDKDCYSNYQYYNGKTFRYGCTAKKMTKSQVEKIRKMYQSRGSYYVYHVGR